MKKCDHCEKPATRMRRTITETHYPKKPDELEGGEEDAELFEEEGHCTEGEDVFLCDECPAPTSTEDDR